MEKHSPNVVSKSFGSLLRRFHMIIFFICIVAVLAVAVIQINLILTASPSDTTYTSSISTGTIDESTLNRVQALRDSNEAATPTIPEGRNNPFGE
jgi:hypothetical protein